MNQKQFPELANFMGFQEDNLEDIVMEGNADKMLYEPHLTFD